MKYTFNIFTKVVIKISLQISFSLTMLFGASYIFAQISNPEFDLQNLRQNNPDFTVAYDRILAEDAWRAINSRFAPLSQIVIGVIEDGVEKNHPEFAGLNFGRTPGSLLADATGHGTSVAGIIGANNLSFSQTLLSSSPQMNGILSGADGLGYVMETRISGDNPWDFGNNLNDLIAENARIINLSLGYVRFNALTIFQQQFAEQFGAIDNETFNMWSSFFQDYVSKHPNVLFVISAGNENVNVQDATPANSRNLSNAIVVAATDVSNPNPVNESRAVFRIVGSDIIQASNFGNGLISAPGTNVYAPSTTSPPTTLGFEDYRNSSHPQGFFRGTSASAPMVTGVAGLIKSIKPLLTPSQIKQILISTGDTISTDQPIGPRLNALKAVCDPLVLNCSATPCTLSGTPPSNRTITASESPCIVEDGATVPMGTTLTIDPGVILKFRNITTLQVFGTLNANGTLSSPIFFTSIKDDTIGGDTNNDGSATIPQSGDWRSLTIAGTGTANLTNTTIRYGGESSAGALLVNGTFSLSRGHLTKNQNANLSILGGSATIDQSELDTSDIGVALSGGTLSIHQSSIHNNSFSGISAGASVNATNNWWGSASGPFNPTLNPTGTGNSVSDNVSFIPFLTSDPVGSLP